MEGGWRAQCTAAAAGGESIRVEARGNVVGVDGNGDDAEGQHKQPGVHVEVLAHGLDDMDQRRRDEQRHDNGQHQRLGLVPEVESQRLHRESDMGLRPLSPTSIACQRSLEIMPVC